MNSSNASWERDQFWSMLAHLTMVVNLFTGVLGIVAALIFYLVFKRRSIYVAFHALQSFFYQLIAWLGIWIVTLLLFMLGHALGAIGFFVQVIAFLLALVPAFGLVYAIFAAVDVRRGNEFEYPYAGKWAKAIINR
jgi:uncharacterized Tic20 family protein